MDSDSPYTLLVAPIQEKIRREASVEDQELFGIDRLNVVRSEIPAVTHVDYSARIQTVAEADHPRYYRLIKAFQQLAGCAVLVNASFNVRGEPIVCTPENACLCFMRTEMDYLVLGDFLLDKRDQKPLANDVDWQTEFELD